MSPSKDALSIQRSRQRRGYLLLALAMLIVCTVYATFRKLQALRNDLFLPPGVKAIPNISSAMSPSGPLWASDHEVVTYDGGQEKLVDIRSGTAIPIQAWGQETGIFNPEQMQVSPDGNLLLCANGPDDAPLWSIALLRGGQTWDRPRAIHSGTLSFSWLPDSRHWVELVRRQGRMAVILSSMDDTKSKQILFPDNMFLGRIVGITPEGDILTSGGRIIFVPSQFELAQLSLRANNPTVKKIVVTPPGSPRSEPQLPYFYALSPDGKRLAWLLTWATPPNAFQHLIMRLSHPQWNTMYPMASLWITDLDGKHPRQIVANFPTSGSWMGLAWMKDGKHLSFYDRGSLCIVDVNPP